jgi:peptidoglycan-associated lipoprotein
MSRPGLVRTLLLATLVVVGCTPSYPNCKKDEDCNRDKPRREFCVDQKCQQCRTTADCATGKKCNKGRCDPIPGFCSDDRNCPEGLSCIENRCKPCSGDGECGDGGKCRRGKCIRKGMCDTDDDCPQDQDCKAGRCVGGAPVKAPQDAPCKLGAIHFDFNESALTSDATETIDRNVACLKRVGRTVQLIGRTDPRGTEEYNLALSERRAQSVKDRMRLLGVDGNQMRVLPKGELDANGRDEAGWAQDRRVDFEWM